MGQAAGAGPVSAGLVSAGLASAGLAPAGIRSLSAGDALFREGAPAAAIFRLITGTIRLERPGSNGEPAILHVARPGEFFAEASLFSPVYHCDAVAIRPSRVETFAKAATLAALRADPDAAERFMALLARSLQATRRRLELRNVRSARERLLLWIDDGGPGGRALEGRLQDIAAELGLTREAFYRTLKALEASGLVARSGSRLRRAGSGDV